MFFSFFNLRSPSLGARARRVANGIDDPGGKPAEAQTCGRDGEAQASDGQGHQEGGQVLGEVGVGALGYFILDSSVVSLSEMEFPPPVR